MHNRGRHGLLVWYFRAICALTSLGSCELASGQSTWNSGTGGSWLDPLKWTGPVPNALGDVATLTRSPQATIAVSLPSEITLGRLNIVGPSTFSLTGTGPLRFETSGLTTPTLSVSGTPRTHQLQVPLAIADADGLNAEIVSGATLSFRGAITTGAKPLTKSGAGVLELFVGNPDWSGPLVVNAGEVVVGNARSLGLGSGVHTDGTRVNSGATLRFNALADPVNELLQLDGGTIVDRPFGVRGNTLGSIELLSASTLRNTLSSSFEPTVLANRVTGPGALNLVGDFTLSGDNDYTGETILAAGSGVVVRVTSATGLGSTDAGTTINANSELQLDASAAEPLNIKGGRVIWRNNSQAWSGPVEVANGFLSLVASQQTFNFPVTLSTAGTLFANSSSTKYAGLVNGAGNLTLSGGLTITGKLAHQGGLTSSGATLDSANHYTGTTNIRQGTTTVNHPLAFGSSSTPIVLEDQNANLVLNRSIDRDITVKNGNVHFRDSATPFTKVVYVERGLLDLQSAAPFAGVIDLQNEALPAQVVVIGKTLNGRITGSGKLTLDSGNTTLAINGDNDYRGNTILYGTVDLNSSHALGDTAEGSVVYTGRTAVRVATDERLIVESQGRIELYAQLDELPHLGVDTGSPRVEIRTPSAYDQRIDVRTGTLQIAAPTSLGAVVMREQGTLLIDAGQSLQLADGRILMTGGTVDGTIGGLQAVTKLGPGGAALRRVHGFRGEIEVSAGTLTVEELWANNARPTQASANRGAIRVTSPDRAVLAGAGGSPLDADVYLNNARGPGAGGALKSIVLAGDLYLGEQGAYVAEGGSGVYLHGGVYGGDLLTPDDGASGEVLITSDKAAYVGQTIVRDGKLHLSNQGRLMATSRIVIGGGGQLLLNNSKSEVTGAPAVNHADRIADDIPVIMHGGEVRFWSPYNAAAEERIGRIDITRGTADFVAQKSDFSPQFSSSTLTVGELRRDPGATVFFEYEDSFAVKFDTAPPLDNGLIGPWAIVNRVAQGGYVTDFAAYGPSGVEPLTSFQQNLAAATINDNVLVSQDAQLPLGVTAVNSLTLRGENQVELDLGGQRLAIDSGGLLLSGNIVNGELAPGLATTELILLPGSGFTVAGVAAKIVDGAAGPTALTAGSGKYDIQYRLSGANTYTGPTRVNNDALILFETFDSLPAGGDMEINGGEVQLGFQSTSVKSLGDLVIRDQGRLTYRHPGTPRVAFADIELQSGSIVDVALSGDAAITKTTDGTATLSLDGRQFAGTVNVYEGTLVVEGSRSIGDQDVTVHGGRLVFQGVRNDDAVAPGDVHLNGGEFVLGNLYRGTVHVNAPARITGSSFSNFARLGEPTAIVGVHPVTFGGRLDLSTPNPNFSGDVTIEESLVARHVGAFGSGDITVSPGATLEFAFPQGGDLANDLILDGGHISTDREISTAPIPARLTGEVTVLSDAIISTNFRDPIEIAGRLELRDGVRLNKLNEGLLTVSGEVLVSGHAELLLGPGFLRQNDSEGTRDVLSEVRVTGIIKSGAQQAALDFRRSGFDKFQLTASIDVAPGQSLELREDGVPIEFTLAEGASIAGNGTFLNPVRVNGGLLDPGLSPGVLTFGEDLVVGRGTEYRWEINDAAANAGQAIGWDLLQVAKRMIFDVTAADPFVMSVTGLNALNQPGAIANFDPKSSHRWLVAAADAVVGFNPSNVRFDFPGIVGANSSLRSENFSLSLADGGVYLNYEYVVPEPGARWLMVIGVIGALALINRR